MISITVADNRSLAVAFVHPVAGLAVNPATRVLEPFDATKHLVPLKPVAMQAAVGAEVPAAFAQLKSAQDGGLLAENPGSVVVFFELDKDGKPLAIADLWPNDFAGSLPPMLGGWGRS